MLQPKVGRVIAPEDKAMLDGLLVDKATIEEHIHQWIKDPQGRANCLALLQGLYTACRREIVRWRVM